MSGLFSLFLSLAWFLSLSGTFSLPPHWFSLCLSPVFSLSPRFLSLALYFYVSTFPISVVSSHSSSFSLSYARFQDLSAPFSRSLPFVLSLSVTGFHPIFGSFSLSLARSLFLPLVFNFSSFPFINFFESPCIRISKKCE